MEPGIWNVVASKACAVQVARLGAGVADQVGEAS